MPGVTKEQYERVNETIFGHYPIQPEDAPRGLLLHTAGPSPNGWQVHDIWEKKSDFRRFSDQRVAPAVAEVTGQPFRDAEVTFFDIVNLVPVSDQLRRAQVVV
jgi:hypothetical protein